MQVVGGGTASREKKKKRRTKLDEAAIVSGVVAGVNTELSK